MALLNYNGKNTLGVFLAAGDLVRLLPGINEIEDAKLQLMKCHPIFKSIISSGKVQIMHETLGKDGKRPVDDMIRDMPKIVDTKLLKKIVETDGRDKVVQAAREQLEKIKNPSKAKADEENEHFS